MAYIAVVPPIRFINLGSTVGPNADEPNNPDDVLILRAFMIYLSNFRKDLQFTTVPALPTLVGKFDSQLSRMIMDYKKTVPPLVMLPPEERGNSRVIPQDERFAVIMGARTTIMALNYEVKPLPGYGDTVIDVMCNLFPIRDILRGLPQGGTRQAIGQPDAYWRDLARNKVPWNKWTRAQQSNAADEYYGTVKATAPGLPQEPWEKKIPAPARQISDRDNELFALLAPYREDLKRFQENRTSIKLTSSPNPSKTGDPVTLTAEVTTAGGRISTGSVMVRFANRQMLVIHGNLRLSKRPLNDILVFTRQVPLVNGTARLILPGEATLADGRYLMYASYADTGTFLGCDTRDDIEHIATFDGRPPHP